MRWWSKLKVVESALIILLIFIVSTTQTFTSQSAFGANSGSAPCIANVQTPGTVATSYSGSYCYIIFKSGTNTWTPPTGVTQASILIIAGGGAGGSGAYAGGGGAGGVVYVANKNVSSATAYSLSVGAGGTPGAANLVSSTNRSTNGDNSWFENSSTLVAIGGGAAASYAWGTGSAPYSVCDGNSGGSGGGSPECNNAGYSNDGGASTQTTPTGATSSYGNAGGGTATANNYAGGGGGGAGAVGTASTSAGSPGAGGSGTNDFQVWINSISSAMSGVSGWSTATSGGYLAGGGGGSSTTGATGGAGGGGAGGSSSILNGYNGTTNTGSGGGGSGYPSTSGQGGSGGSGIVIIRYLLNVTISISISSSLSTAIYNQYTTINATLTGVDGVVTFYADGKRIATCISKSSNSLTSTCGWKPRLHKTVTLTAKLVSSSTIYADPIKIQVIKRSNTR
jgi:hypothetical protein